MRDQFRYQCKNLRREEAAHVAARHAQAAQPEVRPEPGDGRSGWRRSSCGTLDVLPGIEENMRKVDVYSRCYQYLDDITPLLKLLEDPAQEIHRGRARQDKGDDGWNKDPPGQHGAGDHLHREPGGQHRFQGGGERGEIAQLLKRGEKLEGQADCPDSSKGAGPRASVSCSMTPRRRPS